MVPQPAQHAWLDAFGWASDQESARLDLDCTWAVRSPIQPMIDAIKRHNPACRNGNSGWNAGKNSLDPL
jgi:hypothetical protein